MLYSLSVDVSFVYDHLAYHFSFHCVFNSYWGYSRGLVIGLVCRFLGATVVVLLFRSFLRGSAIGLFGV
jgi:hypothetical protein